MELYFKGWLISRFTAQFSTIYLPCHRPKNIKAIKNNNKQLNSRKKYNRKNYLHSLETRCADHISSLTGWIIVYLFLRISPRDMHYLSFTNLNISMVVRYCIDEVVIATQCTATFYWAPPNLGNRMWICRLNFAQRPIFSGLRFFNKPEITDLGPLA